MVGSVDNKRGIALLVRGPRIHNIEPAVAQKLSCPSRQPVHPGCIEHFDAYPFPRRVNHTLGRVLMARARWKRERDDRN
jgi:hypothetical protein